MQKDMVLESLADLLGKNKQAIIDANKKDLASYTGGDEAMLDRLVVDEKKVDGMIASVKTVIKLKDPEGRILSSYDHPNGMKVENKTVPFGKILIIYESRPDVTIEASVIAFKAGNRVVLKGGKEAGKTNTVLVNLWQEALEKNGMDKNFVKYLDFNRVETQKLIKENTEKVDLIIPRGGEGLINFVVENAKVPVIVSGRGNNFLYVDKDADPDMAVALVQDGKNRISVCNALDKVLIHRDLPLFEDFVKKLAGRLLEKNIKIYADSIVSKIVPEAEETIGENIFAEEFLASKMMLAQVDSIDNAIEMINKYSGHHSTSIITKNGETAKRFQDRADCAAVHWNTSIRLTDGGQFGFGAELGTSTQKLHFRGPIGVDQLVTNKWYIGGNGQTRG